METFQHKLQEFDPGIVWLDENNRVVAMNGLAAEVLGAQQRDLIGQAILKLHPEKSRDKVAWLLETSRCPVESPPPMTMMINIPDRVLLIKVSKMCGAGGQVGTCMVFYDVTDLTSLPKGDHARDPETLRLLFKLPVFRNGRVILLNLDDVLYLRADGHYTKAHTRTRDYHCNLSLAELEERLDPRQFVRVHRSYTVNIQMVREFQRLDDRCRVVLDDDAGTAIPISRGNEQKVRVMLGLD